MPEIIDVKPVVKKPLGVRALMSAAFVAGALAGGGAVSTVTPDGQEAMDALLVQEKATARVVEKSLVMLPARVDTAWKTEVQDKDTVRVVDKLVDVPEKKQQPRDKFNPPKYWQAGQGVSVSVRDLATDSLMSYTTVTAGESSLLDEKARMQPSVPPVEVVDEPID